MRQVYATLFLILMPFSSVLLAQNPYAGSRAKGPSIVGNINAVVIDSTSLEPVEFVSAALLAKDGSVLNGAISDQSGHIRIENVKTGKYAVEFSFLGYETRRIENIELTLKKPDGNLGTVNLIPNSLVLDEIEVVEEASLVESKIDRIVYNAEKDISTNGDAADVLRKVPMLSVDLDGNVELRGSRNIQILINGRPSGMFSSNVADALRMIPSEQIKSVEVITSPSAKYDGEGTAGIINIITKKKSAKGTSGSVNLTAGNFYNRGVGNLNIARGRLGFNMSGSAVYSIPLEGETNFYRKDQEGTNNSVFERNGTNESSRLGFNGNAGLYYDLNAFNMFSSTVNIRGFNFNRDAKLASSIIDLENGINQVYERTTDGINGRSGWEWTTDYLRKFDQKGKELSIAFQINGDNSDSDFSYTQESNDPELEKVELAFNKGRNVETTVQADYTHPFSSALTLEVGAKSVLRKIRSDYTFERWDDDSKIFETDPAQTDIFDYHQDVYAGYASFRLNFSKTLGLVAGARYEYTDIAGEFRDFERPFDNSYGNLLPSIILSKKIKQFNTLKFAYNKRIQRPSLFYVNPYIDNDDDRNISYGNPELEPEISHQFEAGYTMFLQGNIINLSTYYRRTNDAIESILEIINDENGQRVSVTTYSNLGVRNSFGLNLFGSYKVKEFLVLRGGIDLNTFDINGTFNGRELSNTGIVYRARLMGTLSLPKDWKVELFGFFNSPRITVQGKVPSFSMMNIGIRKEILKKRGSIGLTITNPFSRNLVFRTELEGEDFFQSTEVFRPFGSVGVNFRYSFGKLDFKQGNRRSKIRNDDLKQGSDSQGNQQMQQGK